MSIIGACCRDFFQKTMKEKLRVGLSIGLWAVLGIAIIVVAIVTFSRGDEKARQRRVGSEVQLESVADVSNKGGASPNVDGASSTTGSAKEVKEPFDKSHLKYIGGLIGENTPFFDVSGLAVAIVSKGKVCFEGYYGTMTPETELCVEGGGELLLSVGAMCDVERGVLTLDDVRQIVRSEEHPYNILSVSGESVCKLLNMKNTRLSTPYQERLYTTLQDLSLLATVFENEGRVNGDRVLSTNGVKNLTEMGGFSKASPFGWHDPAYDSLQSGFSREWFTASEAIILSNNMAIVIAVDVALDEESFESLRSRITSIVVASKG